MKKREFSIHFGWPEFKSIAGNKGINLVILLFIIFVSLIAIGLGESATQYLKVKMDDPFIKFINVDKPAFGKDVSIDDFSNNNLKAHYSYDEVTAVRIEFMSFRSKSGKDIDATARLISESSEFFKFLASSPNILLTNTTFSDNSYGCIVTKSYLESLGYDDFEVDYINYVNHRMDSRPKLPIPIAGIVTQLPGYADILISSTFYKAVKGSKCLDIESPNHKTYLKFYIPDTDEIPQLIESKGFSISNDEELLFNKGIIVIKYGIQNYDSVRTVLLKSIPKMVQFYNYPQIPCNYSIKSDPEFFSFSFNSLDSIIPFKEFLLEKHELKIDMSTIEAKENFNFFNKLSTLLSLSLMAFSIFSIFIFTTNLVNNHIDKNKKNLGTLKAFGLSNNSVITIYTLISALLIIIAFTFAYLLSIIFGSSILDFLIYMSNINIDNEIFYQNINFMYLLFSFIIVPLLAISFNVRAKLKNATPGDLIYDR